MAGKVIKHNSLTTDVPDENDYTARHVLVIAADDLYTAIPAIQYDAFQSRQAIAKMSGIEPPKDEIDIEVFPIEFDGHYFYALRSATPDFAMDRDEQIRLSEAKPTGIKSFAYDIRVFQGDKAQDACKFMIKKLAEYASQREPSKALLARGKPETAKIQKG